MLPSTNSMLRALSSFLLILMSLLACNTLTAVL
jgi:hypothetical protein